ncbi:MAG: YceI family protein [Acidimicrobiales bacterium]
MSTETVDQAITRVVDGRVVPATGTYVLDKAHTKVTFVARHLMVTKVRGHFPDFDGTIEVAENPADSKVTAEIRMASVTTDDATRDGHLRTNDFFDVEHYPTMTFSSTKIEPAGDQWKLIGDLTLRGVTKPVTLDLEFNGGTKDAYFGSKLGFSASGEINRQDFGVAFNATLDSGGVVVSDKVRIEIEAEATLQA